jgi:UDP-N-acetylmuramate--alanine ligase
MQQMPNSVYMVGIGGIGMSALAQLLFSRGVRVSGSDRDESPVTALLAQKGIRVWIGHDQCNIPADCDLLVYSDAVPSENAERVRARAMHIRELSYFEALGEISTNMRTIAVAGTHGKTTTTGMLAAILQRGGYEPTAIVGSIVKDFGSNFVPPSSAKASEGTTNKPDLFVVEACEYRDHLLKLSPELLVITNIELDHTDYFPTLDALKETFRRAAERVPAHGAIVTNPNDAIIADVIARASARIVDYSGEPVPELGLIGEFNRMNARAASAAAKAAFPGIKQGSIDDALAQFRGSWRRFEYKGETPQGAMVYDDYAHHPTAVAKTIEAAREKFAGKRIVVAFHPHLYSRTKSFLQEFAAALALADKAIVAPIYAAREAPDPSISHHILANASGKSTIALDSFDAIRDELLKENSDSVIITMGAGDIYKVAEQIAD